MHSNVPRGIRLLRLRRGWTQSQLGDRIGVSRETVSRLERGDVDGMTLQSLTRIAGALGASVFVQLRWQGANLDRLLDAAHAALQHSVAELLTSIGWQVRVEVSFNHYGDRGRVDIFAYHPFHRVLLVTEIKSALGDLQETIGRLDVKVRLARQMAGDLGWTDVRAVHPALVIGDTRRARRTVLEHGALFARYTRRGRDATAWLRRPAGTAGVGFGLLWFATLPDSHSTTVRAGQRASKRSISRHP